MKEHRVLFEYVVLALGVGLMGCSAACAGDIFATSGESPIVFSVDTLDFGEVRPDEEHKETVHVKNIGEKPLLIDSVKSSCPCVKPVLEDREIPPGESTDLVVELRLDTYPSNVVKSTVFLFSGASSTALAQLEVVGDVLPEYVVEPERLDFGTVKAWDSPTLSFLVKQAGPEELVLERVEAPERLAVSFAKLPNPDSGSQASNVRQGLNVYKVDVRLQPDGRLGHLNAKLTLVTNIQRIPRLEVPVTASIVGVEYTLQPKVIVFGPEPPGTAVGSVEIEGVNDLVVIEAACTILDIETHVEELEPAKRHRISLRLKDGAMPGNKVGQLKLKLREGRRTEEISVSVYGTMEQPRP